MLSSKDIIYHSPYPEITGKNVLQTTRPITNLSVFIGPRPIIKCQKWRLLLPRLLTKLNIVFLKIKGYVIIFTNLFIILNNLKMS
jgi:hypothetical protein